MAKHTLNYTGEELDALLASIKEKYGYYTFSDNKDENDFYHLYAFESRIHYDEWTKEGRDPNSKLIKDNIVVPISTSKDSISYSIQFSSSISQTSNIAVVKKDFIVPLNYKSIIVDPVLGTDNANFFGTVEVSRSTDSGKTFVSLGELPTKLTSQDMSDSSFIEVNKVDLGNYLTNGKQILRLRASYTYLDNEGNERNVYSKWVNVGASVTKTQLSITNEVDFRTPINAINATGETNPFPLSFRIKGAVEKTIHIKLYGSLQMMEITDTIPSSSENVVKDYSQHEQDAYKFMSHGVHKVEAYLTASDGMGGTITTDTIVNRFMVINENTPNADLTKPYLMLQNVTSEMENYVQGHICDYAVYSPNDTPIELTFLVTDYTEDFDINRPNNYFQAQFTAENNVAYNITSSIEIEYTGTGNEPTEYNTYFRVRRNVGDGDTNFMLESTGERFYSLHVDNRNSFSPVAGTDFFINPRVRDNSEANRASIINAIDGGTVNSVWEGFDFVNDGWVTSSDGQKVLRVLAGSKLRIEKNVFKQFRTKPDSSMTIEIDFLVRNVTNETDPVIDMSEPMTVAEEFISESTDFKGLRLNALDGWVATNSSYRKLNCLFSWSENKRTLVHLNINSAVKPNEYGDALYDSDKADLATNTIPLARILVDGDPYREITYKIGREDTNEWTDKEDGYIVIGNDGADVDIYGIRIYEEQKIDMTDLLIKNFVSTRATSEEKLNIRRRNDLLTGGVISLEKVKALGINCMVWHGKVPFNSTDSSNGEGWYEYFRYDENGQAMPEYSGTNCATSKSLGIKGQGSTAKTYYYWNLQDDNSKVKTKIPVAVSDFHESIHVRIDGDKAYIYGGNLGTNFPLEDVEKAYDYDPDTNTVLVPDGWIDGNGKYRGMGYMVSPETSLAQKKVIKINYASSMQSHLLGACKTYDLLHRKVVGATPLQQRISTAVSAKHTEPFMLFIEVDGKICYNGLGVYGAGKADKVSWGYVKKKHPMFAIIEGSDNNLPLTGFRVPFDKNTAIYDTDGEGWTYKGKISFDFDEGAMWEIEDGKMPEEWQADIDSGWQYEIGVEKLEAPKANIRDRWADIHNFIYLLSPNLKFFKGTYEDFLRQTDLNKDYKYWCTDGDKSLILFRYEHPLEEEGVIKVPGRWVNSGLFDEAYYNSNKNTLSSIYDAYKVVNLKDDKITQSVYNTAKAESWETDYTRLNEAFIQAYAAYFKKFAHFFINVESLKFNYAYVIGFLTGTDNSEKNTYYKIMPYAVEREAYAVNAEETAFGDWFKEQFGKDFDFAKVYQIYFDGDDMDSIFRTDNNSHQTKPYYIDRMHPYTDEDVDKKKCLYEGITNALFSITERAYGPVGELSKTTNAIFNRALELVSDKDVLYGLDSGKVSVWGLLHKYFFNVQYYFPQIAFMEQARIRYEFPESIGFISTGKGGRNIRPITQSLGSQLLNELQYMNKRLVLFASYAAFGHLGGDPSKSIGLSDVVDNISLMPSKTPDGKNSDFELEVRPYQYIYPSISAGQEATSTGVRVSPHETRKVRLATDQGNSDTGFSLSGINYYSSIGDLGNTSISAEFNLRGKRMTEFSAIPTKLYGDKPAFRPSSMTVSTPYLKKFVIKDSDTGGTLDLSQLIRCTTIDISSTKVTSVKIPQSQNLETLKLCGNLTELRLENLSNLTNFSIDSTDAITSMYVDLANMPKFTNSKDIIMAMYASYNKTNVMPNEVTFLNVNWLDVPVQVVEWLTKIPNINITGQISVQSGHEVTFLIKDALNKKFGNVDDQNSEDHRGLRVIYARVTFAGGSIKGNYYNDGKGEYQFSVSPTNPKANSFTKIKYSVTNQYSNVTINEDTGLLKVIELSDLESKTTVTATVTLIDGSNIPISKDVEIYNRPAKLGDLVYADGSFGSPLNDDNTKTVVGICCYVADDTSGLYNPNDVQKRLMVSTNYYYSESWGIEGEVLGVNAQGTKTPLKFPDEPSSTVYTMPSSKLTSLGLASELNDGSMILDASKIGDSTYSDGTGMIPFAATVAAGDGYAYLEPEDMVSDRTLDYELALLAGDGYKEGDIVNSGYAQTLKIIQHRNKLLSSDIQYNADIKLNFTIPQSTETMNESAHLLQLIGEIKTYAKDVLGDSTYFNKWAGFYFPAFSIAYAYEPTLSSGEELSPKFKAHNWFPAPAGIAVRLQVWLRYGGTNDIFRQARTLGKTSLTFQRGILTGTISGNTLLSAYNGVYHYVRNIYVGFDTGYNEYILRDMSRSYGSYNGPLKLFMLCSF